MFEQISYRSFHKVTSNLTAGLPIKSLLSSTCCLRLPTFLLLAEVVLQFLFDIYSSVVGCTSGVLSSKLPDTRCGL